MTFLTSLTSKIQDGHQNIDKVSSATTGKMCIQSEFNRHYTFDKNIRKLFDDLFDLSDLQIQNGCLKSYRLLLSSQEMLHKQHQMDLQLISCSCLPPDGAADSVDYSYNQYNIIDNFFQYRHDVMLRRDSPDCVFRKVEHGSVITGW